MTKLLYVENVSEQGLKKGPGTSLLNHILTGYFKVLSKSILSLDAVAISHTHVLAKMG